MIAALLTEKLQKAGITYRQKVCGASLSTFRIGGEISVLIEPQKVKELTESILLCNEVGAAYYVLGQGSNILFCDEPINGAVISTRRLNELSISGQCLSAMCGARLPALARRTAKAGFSDLAFLCGIPGTVGGGLSMNAGAYGFSIGDFLESATAFYPQENIIRTVFQDELNFSYRKSRIKGQKLIILDAKFLLSAPMLPADAFAKIRAYHAHRLATQPLDEPSAGSVFLRPQPHLSAGKIIEELGLKGMRIGGAAISEKHGGFIVNREGATAADVRALIAHVQKTVEKEKGIILTPEIQMIP